MSTKIIKIFSTGSIRPDAGPVVRGLIRGHTGKMKEINLKQVGADSEKREAGALIREYLTWLNGLVKANTAMISIPKPCWSRI